MRDRIQLSRVATIFDSFEEAKNYLKSKKDVLRDGEGLLARYVDPNNREIKTALGICYVDHPGFGQKNHVTVFMGDFDNLIMEMVHEYLEHAQIEGNGRITITQDGNTIGTFKVNDFNDTTIDLDLTSFISNTVNDLVNYYTKDETYTKEEVNSLIVTPNIGEGLLTINFNSTKAGEFNANQMQDATININETDPTVPAHVKSITQEDITNWNEGEANVIEHIKKNNVELTITDKTVNIEVPTSTSQLTNDSNFITLADVPDQVQADWNQVITTAPDYIKNKPTVPSNTSDLNNDNGFITYNTESLLNYYRKSETYNKDEVNALIASIEHFHWEIYPTLQDIQDPQSNVLYLIGPTGAGPDKYEEYVYSNGTFVKIGETTIDLSNYYTKSETYNKTEVDTAINNAVKNGKLNITFNGVDKGDFYANQDNNTFVVLAEEDPTVPSHVKSITQQNINNWNAAQPNVIEEVQVNGTPLPVSNKSVNVTIPAPTPAVVVDNDATLDWNTRTDIGSIDNNSIHITMPANPNTDTQADWNEADTTSPAYINNKPTIPVVNNGTLEFINHNGAVVESFTANQAEGVSVSIEPPVDNETIIYNNNGTLVVAAHHIITDREAIIEDEYHHTIYKNTVYCGLDDRQLDVVNLYDLAGDYSHNYKITFNKNAVTNDNMYAGFCRCDSIATQGTFRIKITDVTHNSVQIHNVGYIEDTPPDGTFVLITTLEWNIHLRWNEGNGFWAYLEVPKNFIGDIEIYDFQLTNCDASHSPNCFDDNSSVIWYGMTQDETLNLVSQMSGSVYDDTADPTLRTPYGKYYASIVKNFGRALNIGDYIQDNKINDAILHTLEYRLSTMYSSEGGGSVVAVQSDWDQVDSTAGDYIKNKPTIPAAQVNADWNAQSGVAEILNKPTNLSDFNNDVVNDNTITIKTNGTTVDSFTTNNQSNKDIDIPLPTNLSDLNNDLVNDNTITIKTNGTTVDSFTTNNSSNKDIDIPLPTNLSDLNNDLVNDNTITIKTNGTTVDSFTTNNSSSKDIDIPLPTNLTDLNNDLVNDNTITIQTNGSTIDTFTTNNNSNKTINIPLPTNLSDLNNDVVNDNTITIQTNGSTVDSFTTNAQQGKTINIPVPTNLSDLNNDVVNDNTITIQTNGSTVDSFTTNAQQGKTINIPIPSNLTDLNNDLVNDNTITIQTNGSTVDSFTTNASQGKTINIPVPANTSDLNNDSGFITNLVNDLTNYYTKSQTYTQAEVDALIGGISSFTYEIHPSISSVVNPQSNVLYLIGPDTSVQGDQYEEYVYTNNTWTKIGDTSIDLSGYAQTTDLHSVAFSGDYNDLQNKPEFSAPNDNQITLQTPSGEWIGGFTTNSDHAVDIIIKPENVQPKGIYEGTIDTLDNNNIIVTGDCISNNDPFVVKISNCDPSTIYTINGSNMLYNETDGNIGDNGATPFYSGTVEEFELTLTPVLTWNIMTQTWSLDGYRVIHFSYVIGGGSCSCEEQCSVQWQYWNNTITGRFEDFVNNGTSTLAQAQRNKTAILSLLP